MTGAIADMTLAQVKAATIRYGAGSHPMTLEELCALYSGSKVNFRCEIKPGVDGLAYERFVAPVIAMLEQHSMLERTIFSSFLVACLVELGKIGRAQV